MLELFYVPYPSPCWHPRCFLFKYSVILGQRVPLSVKAYLPFSASQIMLLYDDSPNTTSRDLANPQDPAALPHAHKPPSPHQYQPFLLLDLVLDLRVCRSPPY